MDYRDGFVHARTSRPDNPTVPEEYKPFPSMKVTNLNPPGWGVEIVRAIFKKLHADTKTKVPGCF
jgi:hypothetical protein